MARLSNANMQIVEDRFGSYSCGQDEDHEKIAERFKGLARFLISSLPDGQAKAAAMHELEISSMFAHKALIAAKAKLAPEADA